MARSFLSTGTDSPSNKKVVISIGPIRIEKDKILGSGGFGTVFEGTFNGRMVAVKRIVIEDVVPDETYLLTFRHRNVLKLLHMEEDQNFRCACGRIIGTKI